MLTAPIATALTRPTNIVSTTPIAIQPISASTSGAASGTWIAVRVRQLGRYLAHA